ncbi:hypothetical protein CHS0354_011487 [Potamilus streckersoni]|uniref:Uncharacterized protein n=1 Tax=Potamilus streckersoni TaxID=2493646 RepID=A0AAE0SLF1_9BIVA|nr:hypothetical protein CHS0354_011487 [Potamilus streckersoni]
MKLLVWNYISLTVLVTVSHTTLPTSTTDRTNGVTAAELSSPEETSTTTTTAEAPTSATSTAISTHNPSVTASRDVSAFYTATALQTNKTDSSGNASTSGPLTTTQEVTQPPATTTAWNTQTPLVTVPGEVSDIYTNATLSSNATDNPGDEISTNVISVGVNKTLMKTESPQPYTTTRLSIMNSSVSASAKEQEAMSNAVRIIIAVVITVIGTTALMFVILILYKRRCKKHAAREDSKPDLTTVQPFSTYKSFRESNVSYAATDTLQYNSIPSAAVDASNNNKKNKKNDETTVKCSKPVKRQKNKGRESGDRNNYRGDVTADEYEMKDVHTKFPYKLSSYDNLPATEGKASNRKYSQVTNQSKSTVPASTENENSQCKSKNNLVDDDDSDNKSTRTEEEDHGAGDRSYVNPDVGLSKAKLSNVDDEDSYNHIITCEGDSPGKCVESAFNTNIA